MFCLDRTVHISDFGLGINWKPNKRHPMEQGVIPFAVELGKKWNVWTASGHNVTSISALGNVLIILLCNLSVESYLLKKALCSDNDICFWQDVCGFTKRLWQRQRTPTCVTNVKVVLLSQKRQLLLTRYICSAGYSNAHVYTHNLLFLKCPQMANAVFIFVK